ncbi:hypothetical protein AVDCRST_MAG84-941 [uncultured Microcoleus sp.]|uniref:Uncharacterized protein n=1 Tax=uncultured Microcoleus sp. TaxID=259945 RepID=A0A6J4KS68_9CYAN|nr:hypothetical protein AVDCRST_MAG84-941 [uncultured Microcoleus sp.]
MGRSHQTVRSLFNPTYTDRKNRIRHWSRAISPELMTDNQ